MLKIVCDNVERLLGQKFESGDERVHATQELLRTMDNKVRAMEASLGVKEAYKKLPAWNKAQLANVEERVWRQYMTDDPKYSQNTMM